MLRSNILSYEETYMVGARHKSPEAMKNVKKPFRYMGMYSAFVEFVEHEQKRHVKALAHSCKIASCILPSKVQSRIANVFVQSMAGLMAAVSFENDMKTKAQVPSTANPLISDAVDFEDKTCTCGKWQETKFPWTHMAREARASSHQIKDYLEKYDSTETYKLQYQVNDYLLSTYEYVDDNDDNLRLPIANSTLRVWPCKRCIVSRFEYTVKRKYHCSNCRLRGHNSQPFPHTPGYLGLLRSTVSNDTCGVSRP